MRSFVVGTGGRSHYPVLRRLPASRAVNWTTYGVLLEQWPLIVANGVCLALSAFILMMKILPKRSRDIVAETMGAKDSKPS